MLRRLMKLLGALGLLMALMAPALPAMANGPNTLPHPDFTDVHVYDYFYGPVMNLADRGVISGYADGSFRPYGFTTRAQFAKMIVLSEKLPINTTGGPHFADVPASHPFYPYIETAFNKGVMNGYADTSFNPGANITRGQVAEVIVRACGWAHDLTGGQHFVDVAPAHPFYAHIETAYNKGIISGYDDGTFNLGGSATRGQIAKMIYLSSLID
jgi:hypothetical protein